MLQPAMFSDLNVVASWIASARDCEIWAGGRVRFPVNSASVPEEIGFSEARFERVSLYVDEANVAAIVLHTKLTFRDASPPAGDPVFPASRYTEHSIAEHPIAPRIPPK